MSFSQEFKVFDKQVEDKLSRFKGLRVELMLRQRQRDGLKETLNLALEKGQYDHHTSRVERLLRSRYGNLCIVWGCKWIEEEGSLYGIFDDGRSIIHSSYGCGILAGKYEIILEALSEIRQILGGEKEIILG